MYSLVLPLPKLTPEGYRIVVSGMNKSASLNGMKPDHLLQFYQAHTDIILRFDQHRGVIALHDMSNISLEIVSLTFKIIRRAAKLFLVSNDSVPDSVSILFSTVIYKLRDFVLREVIIILFQKLTPFRYHKIYILNCPVYAEPLVYVAKKLAQRKIADRVSQDLIGK